LPLIPISGEKDVQIKFKFGLNPISMAMLMLPAITPSLSHATDEPIQTLPEVKVTAEKLLKQAPGVSVISREDIEKLPVANDLSEIIRTQPGVNLTGNSASGYRGNNRQIDLRGMGPENTLILIDGKPVESRQSVKYGRSGDRDTRGDSNWVPAEEVERIEVIRGPAAARYGSGAAGGVVNIVTKGISNETHGSISTYYGLPQHNDEGGSKRVNVNLSGPINEQWGYRIYGSYNKTDSDSPDINTNNTATGATTAAGREGVKNEDLNALFRWKPVANQTVDFNFAHSRQGNIYAGDTQTGASATSTTASTSKTNGVASTYLGSETNRMVRDTLSLTHLGEWGFGTTNTWFQYERTKNSRLDQGSTGAVDGNINSNNWSTATLNSYTLHSEANMAIDRGLAQVITAGVELKYENLDDPGSYTSQASGASLVKVVGYPSTVQSTNSQRILSLFLEDNINLTSKWSVVPGVRLDKISDYGNNWSPSLNTQYALTPEISLKGGIARAFKSANLYQTNPSYLYASSGTGCLNASSACYIIGNSNLKPEISINKEIGIDWKKDDWHAGLTWFRNDYQNKIVTGTTVLGSITSSTYYGGTAVYNIYQWENATNAVIEGLEGNLQIPLGATLKWNNNVTYMRRNDDQYGQPLSVVPKYTTNSTLDWQASDKYSYSLSATFYGKQTPRTTAYNTGLALSAEESQPVNAYNIWGLGMGYRYSKALRIQTGINNLFDKRLYREGSGQTAGAATYNQAGRLYYLSLHYAI
jgi:ferric enterobactin receptor